MSYSGKIINTHGHFWQHSDVDRLVDEWRREGIVKFCVLALGKQFQARGYLGNEGVKKWMDKYPDIIMGAGCIEIGHTPDPVSRVTELYNEGFKGLKFISPVKNYNDESYFGYYEKASELGMPIIFHTGILASMAGEGLPEYNVDAEHMRPYHFDKICRRFPALKIVGAHLGVPHQNEAICISMTYKNVYYDFCGAGGSKLWVSELKKLLAPFPGADMKDPEQNVAKQYFKKFVFATDNPPVHVWKKNSEDIMDYLGIDPETRQDFYWRNAAKIFNLTELMEEE